MSTQHKMQKIAATTKDVYRRKAAQFDRERTKTVFERVWLERFEARLPDKASILDIGCGCGDPISQFFIQRGHQVTGVDYAEPMIHIAKTRFPGNQWLVADMRSLNLGKTFDGIIGWHSFFHLTQAEQRATLPVLAKHLNADGTLMLTVGASADEVIGHVGGEQVYHSSLSPNEYRTTLESLGLGIIDFVFEDPDCGFATILLAQR